jgi:hypothetical protein
VYIMAESYQCILGALVLTLVIIGLSGMSSSLGGLGPDIELQTLGTGFDNQPAGQVFDALIGVPRPFNLLQGLRNLIAPGVRALNTFRPILQLYWKPAALFSVALPVAINLIASTNYGTPESDPDESNVTKPYLLTTVPDTNYIVYQLFIKALPDEGNGRQLAYPNIPTINWQEYTTNLTALQAAGVALIPFIDTIEDLTIVLDDSGFGVAQDLTVLEPRALETHVLKSRAPTYSTLPNSPDWLRLISQNPETMSTTITFTM